MSNNDSQVTTLDDMPGTNQTVAVPAKPVAKPAIKVVAKPAVKVEVSPDADELAEVVAEVEQFFNAIIHPTGDEAGQDIVEIGVNGHLTRIPRGVPSRISHAVLHVLQNAVTDTYKVVGNDVVKRSVPRYPFSATPA